MEILTLASIVTIVLTGALTRVGEMTLEESIDRLKKLVQRKSPDTYRQLEAAAENPEALPATVEMVAQLIEADTEVKEVAEKVAEENQDKPYVINQFPKLEKILNFANRDINIKEQNITF